MKTWFKKKGSLTAIGCCMGHPNWYLVPFPACKITLQGSVLSITGPMARLRPMAYDGALGDPWKSTSSFRSIKARLWKGGSLKIFPLCFIIFLHPSPHGTLTGFPKNLSYEFFPSLLLSLPSFLPLFLCLSNFYSLLFLMYNTLKFLPPQKSPPSSRLSLLSLDQRIFLWPPIRVVSTHHLYVFTSHSSLYSSQSDFCSPEAHSWPILLPFWFV